MKVTIASAVLSLFTAVHAKLYREGDSISIGVKALTPGGGSSDEALYLYPVDYYNPTLGSCSPVDQNKAGDNKTVLFHDVIFQDHLRPSPFNTTFLTDNRRCALTCDRRFKAVNVTMINELIHRNYKLNFFFDDIPVGRESYDLETNKFYVDRGVSFGYLDMEKVPHMFNHFQFIVHYKRLGLEYEILYVTVSTNSHHRIPQKELNCHMSAPLFLKRSDYFYNGNRVSHEILWKLVDPDVHRTESDYYHNNIIRPFVINSTLFMFFGLFVVIGVFARRTINRALVIDKPNVKSSIALSRGDIEDELEDYDFSWPSLVNDVFRQPRFGPFLCWFVSIGSQLTICTVLLVANFLFGSLKYYNSENDFTRRIRFVFMSTLPVYGMVNAYLAKSFQQTWLQAGVSVLLNSLGVPLVLYPIVIRYNNIHASVDSPVHFSYLLLDELILQYVIISTSSFALAYKFLQPALHKVNQIERSVPELPTTFRTLPNMIISGLVPFSVLLVPLSSLYLKLWYQQTYADPSVTLLFVLLVCLLSCISVLNVFYSLSIGNWRWCWFAFLSGASIGLYTFAYSFHLTNWNFGDNASLNLFVLQNLLISGVLALVGGSVSFCASLLLVNKLYSGL